MTTEDEICLRPMERQVSDQFNEQLCACQSPGVLSSTGGSDQVIVKVGNGSGIPGTSANPVELSLMLRL